MMDDDTPCMPEPEASRGSDVDLMDDSVAPSAAAEYEEIDLLESTASPAGDSVYLIHQEWYDQWLKYAKPVNDAQSPADNALNLVVEDTDGTVRSIPLVRDEAPRPGALDNHPLIHRIETAEDFSSSSSKGSTHIELKPDLEEDVDFHVVNEETWKKFYSWYGGGPAIPRKVIWDADRTQRRLVLYPMTLTCQHESDKAVIKTITICKTDAVANLKADVCAALGCNINDVALYDYYKNSIYGPLETKLDQSVDQAKLMDGQELLLKDKQDDAAPILAPYAPVDSTAAMQPSSPQPISSHRFTSSFTYNYSDDNIVRKPGALPGLAGLQNLGNTCFMNSSLQCLAHAVPLLRCFLTGVFEQDLNTDNPLGMKGQLAEAFGHLMQNLWQGNVQYVTPRRFKATIGNFASQFMGYSQHDSQEFLAFLLDGLHEDLNRIKNKPYIEEKDSDGRPDEEVAAEAWSNYRARNDSYIVDHFQGLYKSTLDCPNCGYCSVKFDPFMYLSLPLPETRVRKIELVLVYADGSAQPVQYALELRSTATLKDLYAAVAKVANVSPQHNAEDVLLLAKVVTYTTTGQVYPMRDMKMRISDIRDNDTVVAYRYPSPEAGPNGRGCEQVLVYHRRGVKNRHSGAYSDRRNMFSVPLVLWLQHGEAYGKEQVTEVQQSGFASSKEYVVQQDAGIISHIHQALRPFKRQKLSRTDNDQDVSKARSQSQSAGSNHPSPAPSPDVNDCTRPESMSCSVQAEASDRMENKLVGGNAASLVEEVADVSSVPAKEPGTVDADMRPAAEPAIGPESERPENHVAPCDHDANAEGSSAPGVNGASHVGVPAVEPFDMWAAQQDPPTANGTTAAATDTLDQVEEEDTPPFHVKLAGDNGSLSCISLALHSGQSFVLDWADDTGSQPYNTALLESPLQDDSFRIHQSHKNDRREKSVSLTECVEAFLQPEQLAEEDTWYCPKCKQHVQADKKLDLWLLPEVLVVHLKRFSYTRFSREKLSTLVKFPLQDLDLGPYLLHKQEQLPVYNLFAVSNHYGSLGGGHYTAYSQMPDSKEWYSFDDSRVDSLDASNVETSAAYVLLYRRAADTDKDPERLLQQLKEEQQQRSSRADAQQHTVSGSNTTQPMGGGDEGGAMFGPGFGSSGGAYGNEEEEMQDQVEDNERDLEEERELPSSSHDSAAGERRELYGSHNPSGVGDMDMDDPAVSESNASDDLEGAGSEGLGETKAAHMAGWLAECVGEGGGVPMDPAMDVTPHSTVESAPAQIRTLGDDRDVEGDAESSGVSPSAGM